MFAGVALIPFKVIVPSTTPAVLRKASTSNKVVFPTTDRQKITDKGMDNILMLRLYCCIGGIRGSGCQDLQKSILE